MFASMIYAAVVFFWGFKKLNEHKWVRITVWVALIRAFLSFFTICLEQTDMEDLVNEMYTIEVWADDCYDIAVYDDWVDCILKMIYDYDKLEDRMYDILK